MSAIAVGPVRPVLQIALKVRISAGLIRRPPVRQQRRYVALMRLMFAKWPAAVIILQELAGTPDQVLRHKAAIS